MVASEVGGSGAQWDFGGLDENLETPLPQHHQLGLGAQVKGGYHLQTVTCVGTLHSHPHTWKGMPATHVSYKVNWTHFQLL